ncbi:fungal-specific transcription factor domain-containing protein [Emericellopsis atlantica]|uniref:Fungal-specific transcription factor domain-containing protein n=1 Tax=Emericellopsis atlantica TaxID=2614577 RepID=A0A9P7ZUY3_9HYPO|nr:fungal-specific transcription factor domain-containing protein [Emericellopsis atlantica]KAG9258551.1 fungal-specific transcription factor domain-containing protein [Emericellopsis atlantica]
MSIPENSAESTPEPSPFAASAASRKRKRSSPAGPTTREYGFMRDTGEHDTARFVGSSSGIHFIRNVHMRIARKNAQTSSARPLREMVPGEDDQLRQRDAQGSTSLWTESEVADSEKGASFDQLVHWSKSYFETWHPILPFLHGPDVLRIFEAVSESGLSSLDRYDGVILRSIFSISLADSRQSAPFQDKIPRELVYKSVDHAVMCSQFALQQPASIRATQAALSVQLFLISFLCLNAASRLGGLLVKMAFHLGLHRCPTRYPFFTAEEAARRRRVFWCLYCCERFLSQSLGLPLDIRDDDVDVCYPGEEHHGVSTASDDGDQRLRLLAYMSKHARIRGLILELRNKSIPVRHDTPERSIAVQTELAKWANEIQDTVEAGDTMDDPDSASISLSSHISSGHRLILLLSKYESTISLNRPMMASDPSTPHWGAAMQSCISAAKSICITMKRHLHQHQAEGNRLTVPMLWPAYIWAAWISAFVLAFAAFEQQMPMESALRHIESSKEVLRHLAARNTSWPEYCLSAIDELTSAVEELSQTSRESFPRSTVYSAVLESHGTGRASRSQTAHGEDGQVDTPTTGSTVDRGHAHAAMSRPTAPPVVISSVGAHNPPGSSLDQDAYYRRRSDRAPASSNRASSYPHAQQPIPPPRPSWPSTLGPMDGLGVDNIDAAPGDGAQESMMWYDQLFDSSFGVVDNPFLATAPFDASGETNWFPG